MAKYLITGGSGFIGTNLLDYHLEKGDEVVNLDFNAPRNTVHSRYHRLIDLLDKIKVVELFKEFRPDYVYHLGARTDLDGKVSQDYLANTLGVQNIIAACDTGGTVKRVIFASSRLVCEIGYRPKGYEDYYPTTAYGESKVEGEKIVKALPPKSWTWCVVRPTSIWGPWFSVPYRNFFDAVAKGIYFHPGKENIEKSFGYVGNTVHQLYALMHADEGFVGKKTFYLGDYKPIDVMSFASDISREFNVRKPISLPVASLHLLAGVGDLLEKLGKRAPLTSFRLSNLRTPMIYDFDDLSTVVGALPFDSRQGITRTVSWIKRA